MLKLFVVTSSRHRSEEWVGFVVAMLVWEVGKLRHDLCVLALTFVELALWCGAHVNFECEQTKIACACLITHGSAD